jgi:hypothetical protein
MGILCFRQTCGSWAELSGSPKLRNRIEFLQCRRKGIVQPPHRSRGELFMFRTVSANLEETRVMNRTSQVFRKIDAPFNGPSPSPVPSGSRRELLPSKQYFVQNATDRGLSRPSRQRDPGLAGLGRRRGQSSRLPASLGRHRRPHQRIVQRVCRKVSLLHRRKRRVCFVDHGSNFEHSFRFLNLKSTSSAYGEHSQHVQAVSYAVRLNASTQQV